MLALTEQALKEFNPSIRVELFGQELNGESFGICKSDMLVTGHDPEQIAFGNTLTNDAHRGQIVSLHAVQSALRRGLEEVPGPDTGRGANTWHGRTLRRGPAAHLRRPAAFPPAHDFEDARRRDRLAHRHRHERLAAVFTGGANSGESEIRRWMLENDWVEAIVALPTDLFYNTGIQTYVWLLTNRKPTARRGKVQLIDASGERFWNPCASPSAPSGGKSPRRRARRSSVSMPTC